MAIVLRFFKHGYGEIRRSDVVIHCLGKSKIKIYLEKNDFHTKKRGVHTITSRFVVLSIFLFDIYKIIFGKLYVTLKEEIGNELEQTNIHFIMRINNKR
jgi:hypothetical protein